MRENVVVVGVQDELDDVVEVQGSGRVLAERGEDYAMRIARGGCCFWASTVQ